MTVVTDAELVCLAVAQVLLRAAARQAGHLFPAAEPERVSQRRRLPRR